MLFCARTKAESLIEAIVVPRILGTGIGDTRTTDTGKIRLGGACRLPAKTADTGKIRLGGACRLPMKTA